MISHLSFSRRCAEVGVCLFFKEPRFVGYTIQVAGDRLIALFTFTVPSSKTVVATVMMNMDDIPANQIDGHFMEELNPDRQLVIGIITQRLLKVDAQVN